MSRLRRIALIVGLALVLPLIFALGNLLLQQPVMAQTEPEQTTDEPTRMIQVTGHGEVQARPDRAIVRVGVETEADEATEALEENSTQMSDVISTTVEAGIAEEDIQTTGLQLHPIYSEPGDEGGARTVTGYRARNVVQVTVRDLDMLGSLLDAVVQAGGNTIEGIQFELSNVEELRAEAREAAMNNALAKAEQLVGLADAELGPVLTITESGETPIARTFALQEEVAADQAVPVAPGTQTIVADVQVSWTIE